MKDPCARIDTLERTVLDLGTQLYECKGTMAKVQERHERFLAVLNGLRQLLNEKGLITADDFDAAAELGEVLEQFNPSVEQGFADQLEKAKKQNH